ncbi:MAG: 50S ribosomal protein L1 [Candidatus Thermoplasmatota archaeon]
MVSAEITDAVRKAIASAKERKFRETVELAINLTDVDLSNPKNRVEEEIILPKGRGKEAKVVVFGGGDIALKSKNVADLVIYPEDIDKLAEDKKKAKKLANSYHFFIAEASLMPHIGKKLGMILGPRGKMPKPIPPQADVSSLIKALKQSVRVRSRDKMTFHTSVGIRTMPVEDIAENIEAVLKRIEGKLEKGRMNLSSVFVKTTMGPSVRLI